MAKSAASFNRVVTLKLPSGDEVEAKKPSIGRLIMETPDNDVPQFLSSQIAASLDGKTVDTTENTAGSDLPRLSRFMDVVVKATLKWPQIVDSNPDYANGQILITDLEDGDRQHIFTWAMPEAQQSATSFRQEPDNGLAAS